VDHDALGNSPAEFSQHLIPDRPALLRRRLALFEPFGNGEIVFSRVAFNRTLLFRK
jgi:hypothetical protein